MIGTSACYYGKKNGLVGRMYECAQRNGLVFNGPVYAVYLLDGASVTKREEYLLQISVGTKRKDEEKEG